MEEKRIDIGSVHDYYIHRARWIAERDNQYLPDAEAWAEQRPEIYRQFMASLGLDPLPERCDLNATETGTFSGPGYTAKKIGYQVFRDCWGSATLYRPEGLAEDEKTPAVLYAWRHAPAGVIGNQRNGISWARRGYTCLFFDTIEQHDNPGEHHGPDRAKWMCRGYTAAGGEVFNGMRALDLLLSQPGVDPDRVGVTGLSGGGSQSFFLGVADSRLKAVATLCGVSDPKHAIEDRLVLGHCDCIYIRNVFARDLSLYAALVAPRALLYCFARHDGLFSPKEFRDLHQRTKARFQELGCADECDLCEYDGPHGYGADPRPTTDTIHRWFDRYVAGEKHPDVDTFAIDKSGDLRDEPTLSVFHGVTPEPNLLDQFPRLISPRPKLPLPEDADEWRQTKESKIARLRAEVFGLLDDVGHPQELEQYGDWTQKNGVNRYAWRGRLDGMTQAIMQIASTDNSDDGVVVAVSDRGKWALPVAGDILGQASKHNLSTLGIEPRGAGLSAFSEVNRLTFNREGCLVGLTPTMMAVQDLHHLWPVISDLPTVRGKKLYLYGRGEGAIAMLYHALLHPDPEVEAVILEDLPGSHLDTEHAIMNVLRVTDIPHAVGLLAPTPVALINPSGTKYQWYIADRAHTRVSGSEPIAAANLTLALDQLSERLKG